MALYVLGSICQTSVSQSACVYTQETGQCPYGTKCHFAHDSSELVNVDLSANFVTRSVENDDTESMLSTETAQSKDITR